VVGEVLVDPFHERRGRAVELPVEPDADGLALVPDVRRDQHPGRGAAHDALAVDRVVPGELDVGELLLGPALRERPRRLCLRGLGEDAEREEVTTGAVDQLVGHEPRPSGDLVGERLVDASRELAHRFGL
jgi:hypothetical protein